MSARPIGEIIPGVLERAVRTSILCDYVATFPTAQGRKEAIIHLYMGNIIKASTAELMIDHFGLEAA